MKKAIRPIVLAFCLVLCLFALSSCIDISTTPSEVSFYLNGELLETVAPDASGQVVAPTVTAEAGYRVEGWFSDAACTKKYTGGRTAYARTIALTYKLTYALDGGKTNNPLTFTVETDTFVLRAPTKEGYTFTGWLTAESETPALDYIVPKGTIGDISLRATWSPTVYRITYDLDGGTGDNPDTYTVESDTFSLSHPKKTGYLFYGWEIGGNITKEYTVEKGSTGDITARAVWYTGEAVFSYTSEPSGILLSSDTQAGGVKSGTNVTVSAPVYSDGYVFVGWTCGGRRFSESPSVTFRMGDSHMSLTAVYERREVSAYDKATGKALVLKTSHASVPTAVYGGNARILSDATYASGSATLSADYLSALPLGEYRYYVADADGGAWFFVCVTDSRKGATDLRINYDTNAFPNAAVTFTCTCGTGHTYSLDGGAEIPCESGDVLTGYNKAASHTLTLICGNGSRKTTSRDGYDVRAEKMYTSSFTYGGRTYDYVMESEDEYVAFIAYVILVRGVEDYTGNMAASLSYNFWVEGDLLSSFTDETAYKNLTFLAFHKQSFPMGPSMQSSYSPAVPEARTVKITYSNGLNSRVSKQEKSVATAAVGRIPVSDRGADFTDFPIEQSPELTVRTLYELETLPNGYRPVFADDAKDASDVYAVAKNILRTIIGTSMNDYQKVEAIYLWLGTYITYDKVAFSAGTEASSYRAFTVYGALVDRLAVCDGFASAFRLLCQIEGIECEEYIGRSDPGNAASGHAWNKYRIGGAVYAADATWGRVGEGDSINVTLYYCMMDEERLMSSGHYENATTADRFTEKVADGKTNAYEMVSVSVTFGYDFDISSAEEFCAVIKYMKDNGISTAEVLISEGDLSAYTALAANLLRCGIRTSYIEKYGVCFLTVS